MKSFFQNRVAVALVVAVVLVITMAVSSLIYAGEASPLSNVARILMTPFRSVASGISETYVSVYGYIYGVEELNAENASLKAKIAQMEEEVRRSQQAIEENERLRVLLELSERRRDFEFVMAEIVSRDTSNWESTFNIGKGSLNGIDPFDCVINEEGFLVGYISEVGTNWSIITTVVDSGVELGAIIYRTREPAVAEGDFNLMSENKLKLTYLPEGSVILNGDMILTSGVGSVFPKDLVIGTVSRIVTDTSGLGDYAIIEPATDLDKLTQIFIVTDFEISE